MGNNESAEKRDQFSDNMTCDEKMTYCRDSHNFNPKEWDSLNKKCQDGDEDSCGFLRSKYDGEHGIFASYQNCLQSMGPCQQSQAFQQEYKQLSESPSVMGGMMPFVGGMIMGGLMGSMMQSAFQNRQSQMASQGFRTPYNQPGGPSGMAQQQSAPKHTGTTDMTKQGATAQRATPNSNLSGGGANAAQSQAPRGQGFGKGTAPAAPQNRQQFGKGTGSPQRQRGWSSSGGRGFGSRGGFGRRR